MDLGSDAGANESKAAAFNGKLGRRGPFTVCRTTGGTFNGSDRGLLDVLGKCNCSRPLIVGSRGLGGRIYVGKGGRGLPGKVALFSVSGKRKLRVAPLRVIEVCDLLTLGCDAIGPVLCEARDPVFPGVMRGYRKISLVGSVLAGRG